MTGGTKFSGLNPSGHNLPGQNPQTKCPWEFCYDGGIFFYLEWGILSRGGGFWPRMQILIVWRILSRWLCLWGFCPGFRRLVLWCTACVACHGLSQKYIRLLQFPVSYQTTGKVRGLTLSFAFTFPPNPTPAFPIPFPFPFCGVSLLLPSSSHWQIKFTSFPHYYHLYLCRASRTCTSRLAQETFISDLPFLVQLSSVE